MSFILDALKKSENDRQRQSGPALFEVKVPPPRSRLPLLAIAIVALLVVNLGVVGWLMFREPAEAAAPAAQPPVAAAPQPQAAPPVQQQAYAQQPPPPGYQTQPAPQGYPPPNGYGPPPGAPQGAYGQPNSMPPNAAYTPPVTPGGYPQQQAQQYNDGRGYIPPADPQLDENAEPGINPDDYAPARTPSQPALSGLVRRGNENGLPSYDEAATRVSLPRLHLDLHSYAPDPAQRFILVNMKRLYEGQNTPEGVKVESITPDSAVMSYQGTRFVLNRD